MGWAKFFGKSIFNICYHNFYKTFNHTSIYCTIGTVSLDILDCLNYWYNLSIFQNVKLCITSS